MKKMKKINRFKNSKRVFKFLGKKLTLLFLIGFVSIALQAQESNCGDGIDNDGDGLIDCADTDCGFGMLIYQNSTNNLLSNFLETRLTELNFAYTRTTGANSPPANIADYPLVFASITASFGSVNVTANMINYVNGGGTLVLMGERPVLNTTYDAALTPILNGLVSGGGISPVTGGSSNDNNTTTINASVLGNLDTDPNVITTFNFVQGNQWNGISGNNVWATGNMGGAAAAVWDSSDLVGGQGKVILIADQSWLGAFPTSNANAILNNIVRYMGAGYSPPGGCLPPTDDDNDGYFTDGSGLGNDPDNNDPCNPDNTVAACDSDGDGVPNGLDACPTYAGSEANGCDLTEVSCTDGIDNDGNGRIDCADDACSNSSVACGMDNDNDGYYTNGAGSGLDPDDTNPCIPDNTVLACDTDGDGVSDGIDACPAYAGSEPNGCDSTETLCTDGVDNDGDGLVDCSDSDCTANVACVTGMDNDSDGYFTDGSWFRKRSR